MALLRLHMGSTMLVCAKHHGTDEAAGATTTYTYDAANELVTEGAGGLPPAKAHCPGLAIAALRAALGGLDGEPSNPCEPQV
jgi:hypothetical protein